jgi:VacB/RNase II family 3'-5' exoribonuclease
MKESISLTGIANRAMREKGLLPDFPPEVLAELKKIQAPALPLPKTRDLRSWFWISIDNDDSKDLDQLTYAEIDPVGGYKSYVAVADVDALVKKGHAIDSYAAHNTTSVYTPSKIFPMLPPELSTDLTSLNEHADRCAIIVEMRVKESGEFELGDIYAGWVNNHAKLAYNRTASWLEGKAPFEGDPHVWEQLQIQDQIATKIREFRNRLGALHLQTIETEPVIENGVPVRLEIKIQNRAHLLIENFMIAANVGVTRFLKNHNLSTVQRVVRTPEKWDRIVAVAAQYGFSLPRDPNAQALRAFLVGQQQKDPERFPDLSLTIIKLVGNGEYVLTRPGTHSLGHFDLALIDYAHTTAPNRRFPDLIMQRILKSQLFGYEVPYTNQELSHLATHCTEQEDDATKIERHLRKSAAAIILQPQIGRTFSGLITGSSEKGVWVRIVNPPIEGKIIEGAQGLDVGDRVTVQLVRVDIPQGYIDFRRL